jgi:hypothetical protein
MESLIGQFGLDEKGLLDSISTSIKDSGSSWRTVESTGNSLYKKWNDAAKELDGYEYDKLDAAAAVEFATASRQASLQSALEKKEAIYEKQ